MSNKPYTTKAIWGRAICTDCNWDTHPNAPSARRDAGRHVEYEGHRVTVTIVTEYKPRVQS